MKAAVLLALAAGVLLRLLLAIASSHRAPVSDMAQYLDLARALAAGPLMTSPDRALLYPLFLAGLASSGLGSLLAVYLVQSGLTLAAVGLMALPARAVAGKRAGWVALALAAPQLTIAQYSALALSEALFLPLFALWVALVLAPGDRPPWRIGIAGAAAGIAVLVRPAAIPLLLGTLLALSATGSRRLRSLAIFAVATLLVTLPGVAWISKRAGTSAVLVPTLGVNLYLGNFPGARLDGGGVPFLPETLSGIADPRERNARALRAALDHAAAEPARTLVLALVRAFRLLGVHPGRVEHDALVGDGLPSPLVVLWLGFEWVAMCLLATVALAGDRKRLSAPFLAAALVAAPYILVLSVTFVQTRFRLPLHVLLLPFAAVGMAVLLDGPGAWRGGRVLRALVVTAALLLAAAVVEGWTRLLPRA